MPTFSLIVPTLGRTEELRTLLASLCQQEPADLEVILVDQNDDERVTSLLEELRLPLSIRHLRQQQKNVSAARNAGIDAATGRILAFPDDDCWYPSGLLPKIAAWLEAHQEYAIMAVGALDEDGVSSGNRWPRPVCDIRSWNALRTTFCSSLFIAAPEQSRRTRFDEGLSRGEETDFVLRLLSAGLRGRYDRSLFIYHPRRDMLSGTVTRARAMSYGMGMGRLVRRHSLHLLWAGLLLYDFARAALVILRGQLHDAGFCFAHAKGLYAGFMSPESTFE